MSDGDAKEEALALKENYREADLSPPDRAMLDYAEKITLAPWTVTEGDVQNLRDHGFGDVEILEIASVSAYRNYIARIANSLGVELGEHTFADDMAFRRTMEEGMV